MDKQAKLEGFRAGRARGPAQAKARVVAAEAEAAPGAADDGLTPVERVLRGFDLAGKFGPAAGISR